MKFKTECGIALLGIIANVLDKCEVPFFLIQGTALGAWRSNSFVPNEKDIDIGVLIEDFYLKAPLVASMLLDENVEVETRARHRPFTFCHTLVAYIYGAKADIVGFHRYQDKRFTCTPDDPVNVLEPYCIVHEAEMLETYDKAELYGRWYNVPHPIRDYLRLEYGIFWPVPKEDSISQTRTYDYLQTIPREFFNAKPQPVARGAK